MVAIQLQGARIVERGQSKADHSWLGVFSQYELCLGALRAAKRARLLHSTEGLAFIGWRRTFLAYESMRGQAAPH